MTEVLDRIPAILIANRGEIALRIVRACRELGVRSVAIAAEADLRAPYATAADQCILLPGETLESTYLDRDLVISSALGAGASAIHPGYGFLSENAGFARAVTNAGLIFIGPTTETIELAGDKVATRTEAHRLGIPVLPATSRAVGSLAEAVDFGAEYGYPLLIKAVYGGGGRGLRRVDEQAALESALESAWREASRVFGDEACFLERALVGPRHLEVQVFGEYDGSVLAIGDRDCTLQRRHQKLIEECPAPQISADVRARISDYSVRFAEAIGYRNAGTCEFLLDRDKEATYFLEMNPRIQVEHPVTEMVWGVDLVVAQIREAAGQLSGMASATPRGHAVEIRVNAEDPYTGFVPQTGQIERIVLPGGPGVRLDLGVDEGDLVSSSYDSLIGKLVCWGPDRETAISRAIRAIGEFHITGVETTLGAQRLLLESDTVRNVDHHVDSAEWLIASAGRSSGTLSQTPNVKSPAPGELATFSVSRRRFEVLIPNSIAPSNRHRPEGELADPSLRPTPSLQEPTGSEDGRFLVAPMQGTLIKSNFTIGEQVAVGDIVFVLEAMKMEISVQAPLAGTLARSSVSVGSSVERGTLLGEIEPN